MQTTDPHIETIIAQCSYARPAEAGEQCDCGRPAVLIYEPDGAIATAWCGQDTELIAAEREVRAYAADSGDVILRRSLTVVLAELDRLRDGGAE